MDNDEVIKDFIRTGKAIYMVCQMAADDNGFKSITLTATDNDGGIIEITIEYKK